MASLLGILCFYKAKSQKTTFIIISLNLSHVLLGMTGNSNPSLYWLYTKLSLLNKQIWRREESEGSSQSWCLLLQSTKPFSMFFPLTYSTFTPLGATGSFLFLMGCSRFWWWLRTMKALTAVLCLTLPGRTSVMKQGLLSPQVRSFIVFYSVWIGNQTLMGTDRTTWKVFWSSPCIMH